MLARMGDNQQIIDKLLKYTHIKSNEHDKNSNRNVSFSSCLYTKLYDEIIANQYDSQQQQLYTR